MTIEFIDAINQIPAKPWNALLDSDYPFARHEFLSALEDSGCLGRERGWQPHHLLLWEGRDLRAAMPLYLKYHSYGEYVFDWGWANAYAQHGYDYYPKLVGAIPFTPCRGPRLLSPNSTPELLEEVAFALTTECQRLGASSWHCLFPEAQLSEALVREGAMQWPGCQFHWYNRDYQSFDDFVGQMNSRKRKNLLKERRQVAAQGFEFDHLTGEQIGTEDWDRFYALYQLTYLKRSGHGGYLERDFFHQLGQRLPEHCLMVNAHRQGHSIASALFLRDSNTLYGRYWGCRAEFDFLHFETCYYQGIDYAIAQGLERFDGGAQGEHKLARGFEPVTTYSNHWLAEPLFRAPVARFLEQEAEHIQAYMREARKHLPYKNED